MTKRKSKDVIEKLQEKYHIPAGISQNQLIAFLVALLQKYLHRKRKQGRPRAKKAPATVVKSVEAMGTAIPAEAEISKQLARQRYNDLKFHQEAEADKPKPAALPAPVVVPVLHAPAPVPALPAPAAPLSPDVAPAPTVAPPPLPEPEHKEHKRKAKFVTPEGEERSAVKVRSKDGQVLGYAERGVSEAGEAFLREQKEEAERAQAELDEQTEHELEQWEDEEKEAEPKFLTEAAKFVKAKHASRPNYSKNKYLLFPQIIEYVGSIHASPEEKKALIEEYKGYSPTDLIELLGSVNFLPETAQETFDAELKRLHSELFDKLKNKYRRAYAVKQRELDEHNARIVDIDQYGSGKQRGSGKLPIELNNFQIDATMKKYPGYLGTIAHNQFRTLLPFVKPHGDMGFIINTDNAGQPGTHWQAVFISPDRDREIDFYDSFGRNPDPKLMPDIHALVKKLQLPYHLKFKINKIEEQDASSENCGYYCIRFLVDRFRGDNFKKATGFPHDEKQLEQWKAKFPPFKYIDV